MIQIPMKVSGLLDKRTIQSFYQERIQGAKTLQTIASIQAGAPAGAINGVKPPHTSVLPNPASSPPNPVMRKPVPTLIHPMQKGQKVSLETNRPLSAIKVCLGWNVKNPSCDVDVSAFLLDEKGKVLGDDWFVFYGQEQSPDGSVFFLADSAEDRENITIHFQKLNAKVQKIVFVLTINEAFEKRLNFSMLQEAYVRIIDHASKQELASFQMDAYYSNVTSMMIGEIYRHKKVWKFHAVGNGVARDLAGLCELYGVQVI